ncbi:resolvase [Nitrosopumilus sp. b1]|uniref:resolvase n=1 Tax=Nitrosopumilus sp. b1 TaxID=2109907 RepID=UPI0015F6F492|nr:resolvase [Nitrosopumilus sp. b1]KAF6242980.1 resolvase [Nitrosopumilus sp. b1]
MISNQAVSIEQTSKDNKKIARTRRQRGYHWEDTIVKRFNKLENWEAFRLGSPSVALPDILTVNNQERILFTIEAKSGTNNTLQVPYDQISRCLKWTETFKVYKTRDVILAFKFLSKKRIGVGQYENRELREFFKVWHKGDDIMDCVCTYEGEVYGLKDKTRLKINLKDCEMPFKIKSPRANISY